jgi:hypothetical protein
VGATHPQALVEAVRAQQADYGVALDGDADRLQLVDSSGRLFNGDELLYLMVADRIARDEDVPGCVGTLMTNKAVEVALKERGVQFVRAKVGDRYVLEELSHRGWILGGEGSGHLLALDKHTTGDGLISALQVLQACVGSGKTLAELLGIDLLALPTGTRLHIGQGGAVVELTGLRNPCSQIDRFQKGLTAAVLDRDAQGNLVRKAGVMSVVIAGGEVKAGDAIRIEAASQSPAVPLQPV